MDKPNTLEITTRDIALVTPKGRQHGGTLKGNAVMFGKTALRFSPELIAEIVAAQAAYRDDDVRALRGAMLYDAIESGAEVLERHAENDAYEAGTVLIAKGTGPIVVRFAKSDLV